MEFIFLFLRFPGEKPRGGVGNETYHSLVPALIPNIKRDIKLVHYCKRTRFYVKNIILLSIKLTRRVLGEIIRLQIGRRT